MTTEPHDSVNAIVEGWRAVRDDLDVSPLEVIARLTRLRAIVEQRVEAVLTERGLTSAGFSALAAISRLAGADGVTQARLMQELRLTSGTISVRIDRLVADGLAERHPDPDDRRGTRITLTAAGREAFESAAPVHLANERLLLAALSPEEQRALASLLRRLLIDLEGDGASADAPARALGLTLAPAHTTAAMRQAVGLPPCPGLLVRSVDRGSAAARAGITPGDVLTAIDGRAVRALADLHAPVAAKGEGPVVVGLVRGPEAIEVRIPA